MATTVVFLLAAVFIGTSTAHFKCLRNISCYENSSTIINIPQILSLESICFDFCRQTNCSDLLPTDLVGKLAGGIAGAVSDAISGPVKCLLDPKGDGSNPNKVSPFQACAFPCILDLNLLNICDIQAIVTTLVKICPKTDMRGLCLSACLCCGEENQPLDVCVNLCLSNQGIDLSIKPADLPLLDGLVHGHGGIDVLHIGGKSSDEDEGPLGGILGDVDILGSHSKSREHGGCSKCNGGSGGSGGEQHDTGNGANGGQASTTAAPAAPAPEATTPCATP
jgi:hypothetical protein